MPFTVWISFEVEVLKQGNRISFASTLWFLTGNNFGLLSTAMVSCHWPTRLCQSLQTRGSVGWGHHAARVAKIPVLLSPFVMMRRMAFSPFVSTWLISCWSCWHLYALLRHSTFTASLLRASASYPAEWSSSSIPKHPCTQIWYFANLRLLHLQAWVYFQPPLSNSSSISAIM